MPSSAAESIVFDMNLLQLGTWKTKEKILIENWIKEDNFDDKRTAAANLVSVLIPEVLGGDCSTTGKIRSMRMGQTLHYFEDLLITTKAGIARKFYRDHLNHMLRVMLLANAICTQMEDFSSMKERIRVVVLSSLIHDIAYPIAESCHIFGETIKSMNKCYQTMKFPEFKISFKKSKTKKLIELLGTKIIPPNALELLFKENDHGLIGAIEFVDYVNSRRLAKYKDLFEAVTFHTFHSEMPKTLREALLLKVLVLSDELQDWGRPIGIEKEAAMPAIRGFNIFSDRIEGCWEWKNYSSISPLRQVFSKLKNLGRIEWPNKLNIDLKFILPRYGILNIGDFEESTELVVDYCRKNKPECIKSFKKAWHNNRELFKVYYGDDAPQTENLFDLILAENSASETLQVVHFDIQGKEAIITSKILVKPSCLSVIVEKGKTKLILSDENQHEKGFLFSREDKLVKNLLERFCGTMIVFQGLTSRITTKTSKGLASIYPYPSTSSTKEALRIVGVKNKESLVENLRILRRCIIDRGIFAFGEEKWAKHWTGHLNRG